jgi:hypothetical protein
VVSYTVTCGLNAIICFTYNSQNAHIFLRNIFVYFCKFAEIFHCHAFSVDIAESKQQDVEAFAEFTEIGEKLYDAVGAE